MRTPLRLAAASLLLAQAAYAQDPEPIEPSPGRQYVAVVVGVSSYQNLPDAVHLDFARSDAATVARTMKEDLGFREVFLLADREATRDGIRDTLREEAAQLVGPDDVFIFYFAGHGIGADLDLPTLLAYDSTLENGQEDGLVLSELARDLQTFTQAGTMLVVTDVVHRNQLDGIYFYGPAANQWPKMSEGTMILSASQAGAPGTDGAFGERFASALAGAADANADDFVTAYELVRHLTDQLGSSGQVPIASGEYPKGMVLAQGVDSSMGTTTTATRTPRASYPDVTIDKAKFVFTEGAGQQVQCNNQPSVTCGPTCYVWRFKAGECEVSAVIDGVQMKGTAIILSRGKYDCKRYGPELGCQGPS